MDFGDLGDGGGAVFLVLFWVVLIVAIVWALTRLFPRGGNAASPATPLVPAGGGDSPLAILDRRLASGEIDVDTYAKIRSALQGEAVTPPSEASGIEPWPTDVPSTPEPEPGGLALRSDEVVVLDSNADTLVETMAPGELHA